MSRQGKVRNYLTDNFWTVPSLASTTKELRETLLFHDGRIMARGQLWDIVGKSLGAGVHRVSLRLAGL